MHKLLLSSARAEVHTLYMVSALLSSAKLIPRSCCSGW